VAFFVPLRLASFIAQLFNAVQPLERLGQNDVSGLLKNRAQCIADLRDATVDVRLARLVFGWRQAPTCFDDLKRPGHQSPQRK
jgi:hypothetical protein